MSTVPIPHRKYEGPVLATKKEAPRWAFIYGLRDRDTHEVIYVGQTINLASRAAAHCHRRGATCEAFFIEKVAAGKAKAAEARWIIAYLKAGAPLRNVHLTIPAGGFVEGNR